MKLVDRAKLIYAAATMQYSEERSSNPESPLSNPADWFIDWVTGGGPSDAGIVVSEASAMRLSAVWASTRVLSEGVAALPKDVWQWSNKERTKKDRRPEHRLQKMLDEGFNPNMTAMDFFDAQQGHLATKGNCYSWIEYNGSGEPFAVWPLSPSHVSVRQMEDDPRKLFYEIDGVEGFLFPQEVLHVRGLSSDGIVGYSPLDVARETIGLGLAAQKHGAEFFGKGATPDGVLTTEKGMTKDQRKLTLEGWKAAHQNKRNIAILAGGLKFEQISITPEQAQFLETRQFQVTEIARIFRVPPHMIADLEHAHFRNIEHLDLAFVKYSLLAWIVRWEQWMNRRLFTPAEREAGYFVKFNVDGFHRGDSTSRTQNNKTAILTGWKNRQEVREDEGLNPGPPELEEYLKPTNMANADDDDPPSGGIGDDGTPATPPNGQEDEGDGNE